MGPSHLRATQTQQSVYLMTFNAEEKDFLNNFFEEKTDREKIKDYVSEHIYDFLKQNNHLKTIEDRIFFKGANRYRPYSSCTLTKFILPNFNIYSFLCELGEILSPDYLLFLDFHFLIEIPNSAEEDPSEELCLKFQRGTKISCINEIIKISSSDDLDLFLDALKNFSNADFLNQAFISHSELFEYRGSGLRPYSLLSILVHIQKIK